jgi:hypothetical protein
MMNSPYRIVRAAAPVTAVLLVALMSNVGGSAVKAGEITGFTWSSGVASVGLNPIDPPVAPNNDSVVGPSPNVVFVHQKDYVGIGPVDIEFTVVPSGGVTEYAFVEGVQNGTGISWTDYHIQLGFGMGAAFVPSPAGDGLDFDAPAYDSPFSFPPFSTVVVAEDGIDAFGGLVPSPAFVSPWVFHVDVPDGITAFTVRQYPTIDLIPEPAVGVLSLLSALAIGCLTRRRRS